MRHTIERIRRTTLLLCVRVSTGIDTVAERVPPLPARARSEDGQTVAEYALVLLVAAAIAGAFLLWARQSGRLDAFFDAIFERLLGSVEASPTPTPAPGV